MLELIVDLNNNNKNTSRQRAAEYLTKLFVNYTSFS